MVVSAPSVNAQGAVISVDPSSLEVDIGEPFMVNINISNVVDPGLYGYELKVYYNVSLLDATDAEYPSGHFLDGAAKFETPPIFEDNYVLLGCILLGDVPGATGSGILVKVEFNGTSAGNALLEVNDVVLLDPDGNTIPVELQGGNVNIQLHPEPFPLWIIVAIALNIVWLLVCLLDIV